MDIDGQAKNNNIYKKNEGMEKVKEGCRRTKESKRYREKEDIERMKICIEREKLHKEIEDEDRGKIRKVDRESITEKEPNVKVAERALV